MEPCGPECRPLLQDCDAGEACFWIGDSWACQTRTDDVGWAEPCTEVTDCGAGLLCVEGARVSDCGAEYCCTEVCELSDDFDYCSGESSCMDVFSGDDDEAGACLVPVAPDMPAFTCMELTHERREH